MSTPDDASGSGDRDEAQDDAQSEGAAAAAPVKPTGADGEGAPAVDAKDSTSKADKKAKKAKKADKPGIFARFGLFLRQVLAELRKVIWPTRSELINYTTVVIIFVVVMALILAAYDFVFAKGVFFVFSS